MTASRSQVQKPRYWRENDKLLTFVPFSTIVTPKSGSTVMCDMWWTIHPDKGAVFLGGYGQYNRNLMIAEFISERSFPWSVVWFLPMAFIPKEFRIR
jgi:hypothetical protein